MLLVNLAVHIAAHGDTKVKRVAVSIQNIILNQEMVFLLIKLYHHNLYSFLKRQVS